MYNVLHDDVGLHCGVLTAVTVKTMMMIVFHCSLKRRPKQRNDDLTVESDVYASQGLSFI